jgi:alpha-L-fucosidase
MEYCKETRDKRVEWFMDARYGMFIHWGLYSIPARGEWIRSIEGISNEDYQPYFDKFDPKDYNPKEWAQLAADSGMKYAVLTAKHHDGFCLFDSALTDYKSTNTPAGRDLIAEYVEAFRAAGIKVGLYYSLIDWYHSDYPAWGDRQHPMRDNPEYKDQQCNWDNYIDYMHGQVRELMTNYGKIDLVWFDFSYHEFTGEKWGTTKLLKMMRSLQPDIVVDNRMGGNIHAAKPESFTGDYAGPEQVIPHEPLIDEEGRLIPWELCLTLNDHFGYCVADTNWKTSKDVIRTLVNCTSKGGNLMINVGPDANGRIPIESQNILLEVGDWLKRNGDSIYGCGIADYERPDWGRFTQKGNILYGHVLEQPIGHPCLPRMKGKIKCAWKVDDESEIITTQFWNRDVDMHFGKLDDIYFNFGLPAHDTFRLPDEDDTVVAFELK